MENFGEGVESLIKLNLRLRGEDGCHWDRSQTIKSLKKCLKSEANEVLDAIDKDDMVNLCEELGDLLYNIIFISQIAEENDFFDFNDVISGIRKKIISRHPHVFGDTKVKNSSEAERSYIKAKSNE